MKYRFKIIIIALLLCNTISFAQSQQNEILKKSYTPASKNTKLEVSSNFGNINLVTWDNNSIDVSIKLESEGFSDKEISDILDKIDLKTNESAAVISIKTDLKSYNFTSRKNKSFKINYEIKMPDNHPLSLKNEFGNIFMTDYKGKADINLEYGDLTAGSMQELHLRNEFGKVNIESITSGDFDLEYINEFSLQTADRLILKSEFSKLEISTVSAIEFDVEYGKLEIGEVNDYDGNAEFCSISIDTIFDNFNLDAEYASGTIEINQVSKNIKSFNLDTSFSKSELTLEKGSNFKFDTDHSFGKLNLKSQDVNFTMKEKDMNEESYQGTIGKTPNQANTTMRIKTSYGGCTIIGE